MATPDVPVIYLSRYTKEYVTLELLAEDRTGAVITPALYTASFDGGVTWVNGTAVPGHSGWWQWEVAGPLAPDTTGATVLTGPEWVNVLVRFADSPEIPANKLATIQLV